MKNFIVLMLFLISACATKKPTFQREIATNDFKLCFIGDTGINSPAQGKVAELLEKEKCHSIHFLGDIIYDDGLKDRHDKDFRKKFWNYYGQLTTKDHKPKLNILLGNHDHKGSIDAWVQLSEKYPSIFFPYPYYLLKLNDVCMTHFDTDYYKRFTNYLMEISQNKWLNSIEQDLKSCRVRIALAHHSFKSRGKSHGDSTGNLKSQLKKHIIGKYDYFISGHDHILSDEGEVKKTRLLVSGAGGKHDKNESPGFLVMNFKGYYVSYEFRKISAE
jgi:predicted phosphodiesterase